MNKEPASLFDRLPRIRMADWMLAAIILFAVVAWMAPQQLGVTVYKMALVALAALAGYWIDRSVFPYAKPDQIMASIPYAPTITADTESDTAFTDIRFTEPVEIVSDTVVLLARTALLRRAIIISATIVGICLGA